MPAADFIALFTAPLERLGVPYMITGATAAILYGQPRLTNDLDVVIELQGRDIERLRAAFPEEEFYVPPAEAIGIELARTERGHFTTTAVSKPTFTPSAPTHSTTGRCRCGAASRSATPHSRSLHPNT